ncbi:antitoxin VbhA family protein (plasmid) [Microvirga sp. VF16]|nr:antitoxin VbhA family protein [Microvirga sp. VF16]
MIDHTPSTQTKPPISPEERARRQSAVELATHNNLMAGAKHDPRVDHIFEAYVEGHLDLADLLPLIKSALGDDQ